MGFNKKFLPELDKIIEDYDRLGHDEFRRIYLKYDAFFGMDDEKDAFLNKVLRHNEPYVPPKKHWYTKFFNDLVKPFQTNKYNKK